MPRFKLTLEYDGTRYSGWQIQKNARTVQGELDARGAHGRPVASKFELYGSGRTDAGVHALAQVAHLDVATTLPPATLRQRINDELPADINVLRVDTASHRFHARHGATARSYVYQIARRRTAFAKPFVWWVTRAARPRGDARGGRAFIGLQGLRVVHRRRPRGEVDDGGGGTSWTCIEDGDLLLVRVVGSHFLWKMVRRMVGVLVAVGRGELQADEVARLLASASASELPARLTAPASGLFLEWVTYEGDAVPRRERAVPARCRAREESQRAAGPLRPCRESRCRPRSTPRSRPD